MGLIQWDSKYEVDVKKIDKQHKKIVRILNKLYDMRTLGKDRQKIQEILDDLRKYIEVHFHTEEEYLKALGCTGYEEQLDEHSAFIDRICEFQQAFLKNKPLAVINMFNFVWDWFSHHILTVDKKCMAGGAQ